MKNRIRIKKPGLQASNLAASIFGRYYPVIMAISIMPGTILSGNPHTISSKHSFIPS